MKLIIDWYEDGELVGRKFLRREVISTKHDPNGYFHAWMTEGKIWKNYAIRRLTEEEYELDLRKKPI